MSQQIIFSKDNHWRFGWGDGLYNFTEQQKPLWVSYGPCRRQPKAFDLEMAETVKCIAEKNAKPIYVAISGGIDSELIAHVMIQEKIPFTPVIVQFDKGLNRTDIAYAFEFCKTHQLSPEIIHLDILKFFKDSVHTPYILANGAHLMQMHIMRHVHNLGGVAVIGVGEQRYERMNGKIVLPVALERIAVTHFMQQEQIDGVSAFYCYTPEIMLCLLQEAKLIGFDFISRFAHNIKSSIYRKYWPHMSPRLKLSGLEDVSLARHELENHLLNKYKTEYAANFSQKYLIPIELFEKQLTHGLTA